MECPMTKPNEADNGWARKVAIGITNIFGESTYQTSVETHSLQGEIARELLAAEQRGRDAQKEEDAKIVDAYQQKWGDTAGAAAAIRSAKSVKP
jgi:hypothetical protein